MLATVAAPHGMITVMTVLCPHRVVESCYSFGVQPLPCCHATRLCTPDVADQHAQVRRRPVSDATLLHCKPLSHAACTVQLHPPTSWCLPAPHGAVLKRVCAHFLCSCSAGTRVRWLCTQPMRWLRRCCKLWTCWQRPWQQLCALLKWRKDCGLLFRMVSSCAVDNKKIVGS